jgi:hypothetical protein
VADSRRAWSVLPILCALTLSECQAAVARVQVEGLSSEEKSPFDLGASA